ncbi:sterol desaturase family protein [Desmospora profundinema]|uniref:Sterol desaturase/sphingolipid hydroxylase (Fatty acid hydroxylase superfamily) n=1 Tax=Desmospora profundinema TaxID=1571184 RepID=A0ABU1IHF2_9BACL|nr:sterol desaturase family protein [Desmospora profundinema]MDR6224121.1 sterol desaturase/sphingolipid hydroxylase (fatty acid hydroxylase superfamily) [Desmospora profundinema]
MKEYWREFWFHPDIASTAVVLMVGLVFVVPHLGSGTVWLALVAGLVAYAMAEYLIHRFVFHFPPPKNRLMLKMLKRLHYDHHQDPNDLRLLFLPIWYSWPLIGLTVGIAFLLTQSFVHAAAFAVGVMGYLLHYEWMHYIAHRPVKPRTPWGRYMKRIHLWHHYKNEHYWYGVTHPVMDYTMGTMKREKETHRSDTVRDLENPGRR